LATCILLALESASLSGSPPRIIPTLSFQNQAVNLGASASFQLAASGSAPFTFQWKLDGRALPGQTNSILTVPSAQAADEGDCSVLVTNDFGAILSVRVRLWVVPPATNFIKANFTNSGQRLPYFYLLP